MKRDDLYLRFLMDLVGVDREFTLFCSKLLEMDFWYDKRITSDRNRNDDGLDLRDLFLAQFGYLAKTESKSASVLEVLVALSIRIDKDIMGEPGESDPGKWFDLMIVNLGLSYMTDKYYNASKIESVIFSWMHRGYDAYGHGSLFPLSGVNVDQRDLSIWDQMSEYMVALQSKGEKL